MTQIKQIKSKIKELLKDDNYLIGSIITANILKVFPENREDYNSIQKKLYEGLDCKVSEIRFGLKISNTINIYMDIRKKMIF